MTCEASRNDNGGPLKTIGVIQLEGIKAPLESEFCQNLAKSDLKAMGWLRLKKSSGHFSTTSSVSADAVSVSSVVRKTDAFHHGSHKFQKDALCA